MLRKLCENDIEGMLEWMHDEDITKNFRFDAKKMNRQKCIDFVKNSFNDQERHYCITDDSDSYLGTISLKNIDLENKTAEYAIVLRKKAIGTGIARKATEELLGIAFNELNIEKVYLNVLEDNVRARRFYSKMGFQYEGLFKNHIIIRGKNKNLCWYACFKSKFISDNKAKLMSFSPKGDARGKMVIVDGIKDIPFEIKRIFYIYGSDNDVVRGQHANRKTQFMLINVCGTSKVKVDYGYTTEVFALDEAHKGVYIPQMLWKDMYDFSPDSVLLVLASENYDPEEYIRDKEQYYKEIGCEK